MGCWGKEPVHNDSAADWFGDLFDATGLADRVREALLTDDLDGDHETVRAAAYVLLQLGHVYVWPIERLDEDLQLAADRLEAIRVSANWRELTGEDPEWDAVLAREVSELRARIKPG